MVQDDLKCTFEWKKAAVAAATVGLAKMIRASSGIKHNEAHAPYLGIDFGCGKTRRAMGKNTIRKKRLANARKRKGRLFILRKVLGGKRPALIAASSVVPAACFGAAV